MLDVSPNSVYPHIKFCPECGKELEHHPVSGWKACFLHGDMVVRAGHIIWEFTENLIDRSST